jgi:serine/threonine protein kinase
VTDHNNVIQEYVLASWSVLEQYRIEEILRYDRFSITYKAFDIELDHLVNIKESLPQELVIRKSDNEIVAKFPSDEDVFQKGLKYFMEEAETLAKFSHPNIVQVLGCFRANGTAYMVMSHEDGETLRKQLDRMGPDNTMPECQIKLWLRDILDGIEAIHEKGIYHRDIRPDTIFLKKDGSAMLIDFGAAGYALNSEFHNENAVSPSDYSPEDLCADEGKGGLWTDIYQLGAVVYECVTGQEPPDIRVRVQSSANDEPDPILEPLKQAGYQGYSKNFLDTIVLAISFSVADQQPAIEALKKLRLKSDKLVPGKKKKEDVLLDEAVSISEPEEIPVEKIFLEMKDTDEPQEVKGEGIVDEADISEPFQAESEEKTLIETIETDEEVSISEPEEIPDREAAGATDKALETKKEEAGDKPYVPEHVQIDYKEKVRGKDKKGSLLKIGLIGILVIGLLAAGFFVFLRPGLKVVSEPSSSAVFLDKNHAGETPLSIRMWMVGKHIISATRKSYHDFKQSIEMQFGKTKKIFIEPAPDIHLESLSGSLVVQSTPMGATVFVDGKEKGVTPLNLENVEKGLHIVKVTKNCFSVMEKKVDITASKKIDIDVKLESICGSLVVKSSPEGATVFVDGKEKGVTPLSLDNVKKGNLAVKLIKKGFETESKIITVKPSEKFDFFVKLRQPIVSSDGRFIDHGNGAISDTKTGLMWTREDSYVDLGRYLNWGQSRSYVNKLSTGGYSDWRLPKLAELKEIYEIKKSNTDKDGDIIHIDPIFSSGGTFWNWSSEEQDKCCAKVFLFIDGSVIKNNKKFSYERGVRAVRP